MFGGYDEAMTLPQNSNTDSVDAIGGEADA
jgi:hypothetical protein